MKIPGFHRDEDGTLVITISQTMRLVILASAMMLAVIAIWWVVLRKEQTRVWAPSGAPGDIIKSEDFADDEPDPLLAVESRAGVSPHSLLTIEGVAGADRDELEKIFDEILSDGLPDLQSEEAQLYDSLIARSAEIAPNRSLRFYDKLEGGNQRPYSISQLYKKWVKLNPEEAIETAKLLEEPLRFHILSRDLLALAETKPGKAFSTALLTRTDYFKYVRPDFVRSVVRTWSRIALAQAEKAAFELSETTGRREAVQGLALGVLDRSQAWADAYKWAGKLSQSQDRLWAGLAVVEMGLHRFPEEVRGAIDDFPHQALKQHLLRCAEAKRLAMKGDPQKRLELTTHLFRSTDPYDFHGRLCVLNTFEDQMLREYEGIQLRTRWPQLGEVTYLADGYLLCSDVPPEIRQEPLVNLLARGDLALAKGDLKSSHRDFLTYLHYNPHLEDADPYLTRWSRNANTYLGPDASLLDDVIVAANSVPEDTNFHQAMRAIQKQFQNQAGRALELYIFEAISGRELLENIFAWGDYPDTSARQALDALTINSGLTIYHKDYGIVGYYFRDQDVAMMMGTPPELIPYPID